MITHNERFNKEFNQKRVANSFDVILGPTRPGLDLFQQSILIDICKFQKVLYSGTKFAETKDEIQSLLLKKCGARSLGAYVAAYAGRAHCLQLTKEDVYHAKHLITECGPREREIREMLEKQKYVKSKVGVVTRKKREQSYRKSFDQCVEAYERGLLKFIIAFLVPVSYSNGSDKILKFTRIFGNEILSRNIKNFYKYLLKPGKMKYNNIKVVGLKLCRRCKHILFPDILLGDFFYLALGLGSVMIILMLYTGSVFLMIATLLEVCFSFIFSYFVYHLVLGLNFFPSMNVVALLILVAIGTDDVFIFFDTFQQETYQFQLKNIDEKDDLIDVLEKTLEHVITSISVTSLTTSTAFFAGTITSITALKCFSIFSVGTSGIIVVLITPKFKLPSQDSFPVYRNDVPLEAYEQIYHGLFRDYQEMQKIRNDRGLPLHFVFGSKLEDRGSRWDPEDVRVLNPSFKINFQDYNTLNYFKIIGKRALSKDWTREHTSTLKIVFFIDFFEEVLKENCNINSPQGCCGIPIIRRLFPVKLISTCFYYVAERAEKELKTLQQLNIDQSNSSANQRYLLDYPIFNKKTGRLSFFLITLLTKQGFTSKYEPMNELKNDLDDFWQSIKNDEKIITPKGTEHGFYSTYLLMYEIQNLLSSNTYESMGISLIISFLVMLATTLNILITVFAIISIAFAIFTTTGILVLCGWQLNIIESVTISLAVGMSIDFAIHYGVAYKLSKLELREDRMRESLKRVGSSVTIASLTTILTGLCAITSSVDVFQKLGTFLVTVMIVSWIFATFFFLSLCALAGPEGACGQLSNPLKLISLRLNKEKEEEEEEEEEEEKEEEEEEEEEKELEEEDDDDIERSK
ncbi:DgyrCDS9162 [Dimorphilus gyrociliatus]|uniref:DgyrCDS9162 n=1 Tax=Dimorphilus gyrociliatus TaxID=2664684 RepID=A0A7I8VW94_9ANNE|nr:DgyrCDS9162 [Dimorphilus gyrociliatus]